MPNRQVWRKASPGRPAKGSALGGGVRGWPGFCCIPDKVPLECPLPTPPPAQLLSAGDVAGALRRGAELADRQFDQFLRRDLAALSEVHWTPLAAAARAAEWINDLGLKAVLDIGSGAGKFCVATALASNARFIGLERRPKLVSAARRLARLFRVEDRVRFLAGAFADTTAPVVDGYYLYNPFAENLFGPSDQIDAEVPLGPARFIRDIIATEDLLRRAPAGTYVITYNGFGGRVPPSYIEFRVDHKLPALLQMWRKTNSKFR
jgi:SAM-dependent methyltransferase